MKKLAAFAAAAATAALLATAAWQDNPAQDAADHAPLTTCKAVR